jgi:hypothetical protein
MQAYDSRGGRRSLALTIVILAAAGALGACAGETTAPTQRTPSLALANTAAPSAEPYTTSVDLVVERVADSPTYGTTVRIGVECSASTVFDLIIELEQQVKVGKGRQLVEGSNTWSAYPCDQGKTSVISAISPTFPKLGFTLGRATVRARIANYQPGVEPADVTSRVRIVAGEE